jgi:PAS domain S-box-containing protein
MISLFVFAGCGQIIPHKDQPRASKGVLDLSDWDFEKDGPVELSGEYEFYWQQHLASGSFSRAKLPKISGFIRVPGYWKGYELNGTKLPGAGYATYRLTVLLKDSLSSKLAFKFLDMGTAYAVFANGEKILSVGIAGVTAGTTVPRYFPQEVDFAPDSNVVELVYQVSNFHHTRGGAWEAVFLGTREQINNIRERRMFLDLLLFGSILIMGLYHLAIFGFRKNDLSSFFFGLFCLIVAVRLLTTVERFLLHLFPEMRWELFVKIEYLSYYLAVPVFALFLYKLFSQDIHKSAVWLMLAVGLVFSGIVGVAPARVFTQTLFAYQLFNSLCMAYTLFMIVLCAARKREGAAIILIGLLFLFATVINDMLDVNVVIQTGHFVHLGLFIFIFSHAFMLSFRYTRAFKTIDLQRLELEKTNVKYEREIAERVRAETALRHGEERYRALYENNPSMYFTVDAGGKVLSVNQFGAEQLGYTIAELVGQPVLNVFHPEDKSEVLQQLQTCLQNPARVFHWEFRKIRKNGTLLWVKEQAHAVRDAEGKTVAFIVCEDITEHKRMELALRESEKLAATGRMAARVAHEINNPLGGIQTAFKLISCAVPQEHRHHHYVGKIEKEIGRIARIVRQMLDLYKPDTELPKEFRIDETIQDLVTLLKPDLSERKLDFTLDLEQAREKTTLPEDMLRQILYNLILNAIEASPDAGIIRITAAITGNRLQIAVADQGEGIPAEIGARIFEPFFTTKRTSTNRGAGLGLSVCKTLVETMAGEIAFTSEPGKGTAFRISLPLNGAKE